MNSTLIRQDPTETERTVELRVWYDTEGKSMDLPDLSKGADVGNRQSLFEWISRTLRSMTLCRLAVMKTLAQIITEGLGLGDKPDYVSVKAMTTMIKKDNAVYMVGREREVECNRRNDRSVCVYRCVQKTDVERKSSMKTTAPTAVKNVIRRTIISNGPTWFRYVYTRKTYAKFA